MNELLRECIHEAGHAIVARILGVEVRHAQIGDHSFVVTAPEDYEHRAMINLAGGIAEQEFGYPPPYGMYHDRAALVDYAFYDASNMQREVHRLVRQNMRMIEFMAINLLEEGRLTGEQIDFLIRIAPR